MFLKLKTSILVSAIIMIAGLVIFLLLDQPTSANDIPDTEEARDIMATLDHAYQLLDSPVEIIDFEEFDNVFIDHSDYRQEISAERFDALRYQVIEHLGSEAAQDFGYRTSMKSKLFAEKKRYTRMRAVLAKAEAENRTLSKTELDEIAQENHGYVPALPDLSAPPFRRELKYFSLTIHGDKARATYDEGVTGRTAILVRIDGKWYVAGIF